MEKMKFVDYDEFFEYCTEGKEKISYDDFKKSSSLNRLWDNTISRKQDERYKLGHSAYLRLYYDVFIENFETFARTYFDNRLKFSADFGKQLRKMNHSGHFDRKLTTISFHRLLNIGNTEHILEKLKQKRRTDES